MTAVALEPAGLCQADPVTEPNGKPGFRLWTARFAPQSLWVLATGSAEVWDVTCYRATVTEQMPLAWQSQ